MDPTQTNTKEGPIIVIAAEDLTGKEGRVVVLTNSSGAARIQLPNDVNDNPHYVLLEGGASGADCKVEALGMHKQFRVYLDGGCNAGDELTLAAIDGTKDGKVRTLPATADDYYVFLRSEEKGVTGQQVLVRLIPNARKVTVS